MIIDSASAALASQVRPPSARMDMVDAVENPVGREPKTIAAVEKVELPSYFLRLARGRR
jgi:hypothetical protein